MSETRGELIHRKIAEMLDANGYVPSNVIEVRSGAFVDPLDLDPELVFIEDIAFALSNCARFSGHTGSRGAEHALIVEDILRKSNALSIVRLHGLIHDAHEAYLVDVPRPLKYLPGFEFYREACDRAQERILTALGIPALLTKVGAVTVKEADDVSLLLEARRGLPSQGEYWSGNFSTVISIADALGDDFGREYQVMTPQTLETLFIERYDDLRGSGTMLVGITGYARSGKDTFARVLIEEAGFERYAFMDPLKVEVATFLGITVDELESRKAEFRATLQCRGTDYWRAHDPEHYTKYAAYFVNTHDRVVITDVHYPNEAEWIRSRGGVIVRIKRVGQVTLPTAHKSETSVDEIAADFEFSCESGVKHVRRAALEFLVKMGERVLL